MLRYLAAEATSAGWPAAECQSVWEERLQQLLDRTRCGEVFGRPLHGGCSCPKVLLLVSLRPHRRHAGHEREGWMGLLKVEESVEAHKYQVQEHTSEEQEQGPQLGKTRP